MVTGRDKAGGIGTKCPDANAIFYLIIFQFSPLSNGKEQHYCNKVFRLVDEL